MPTGSLSKPQRRKAIEKMAKLFQTESHYAPYDDRELSKWTGLSVYMARYYRKQYFGLPESVTRRAEYLRRKKDEGTLPPMGLENARRKKSTGDAKARKATAKKAGSRNKAKSQKR